MEVCLVIKSRLEELGLEQKDLAAAAEVTESYVSQLLSRKKLPPAPNRTDIYGKMESFLKLSSGKLAKLAHAQRTEKLRQGFQNPPTPLFREARELVLGKCAVNMRQQVREIFERQPFGELERFVTQKLLDVIQRIARSELENEQWLRKFARVSGRSYKQMRVSILEFLDTDVFSVSAENCVSFLDPLLESWKKMSTEDLLLVLDSELWEDSGRSRWTEVAHLLSDRGLDGDRRALAGLLRAGLDLPDIAVEREYRTYLADAFARGGTKTVEVLARFDRSERERIAAMIVDASLDLFHGDLAGASAPWPTRRVPQAAVNAAGRSGWTALREAEESYDSRTRRRST